MGIASFYRKTATAAASGKLDGKALDQLFREARTHNGWRPIDVPDSLLEEAVELAKMGPTSANTSPLRIVFVRSSEAKARQGWCAGAWERRQDHGRAGDRHPWA